MADFHADRPGITEQILRRTSGEQDDPYRWLLDGLPPGDRILDLACGTAPLSPALSGRFYVGMDTSSAELNLARSRGARGLVRAAAAALPLDTDSVDVVVCSMALHVLNPLSTVLGEIGRVLAPEGQLVAIMPARGPLQAADLPLLGGLVGAVGRGRLTYPNDPALERLPDLLTPASLRLVSDEHRRFDYSVRSTADADRFLASLYLPNLPAFRFRMAKGWLHALARMNAYLPIPIRRIVAVRAESG